jgi:alkylation response protein AidB-like acyl-CoA dehydrogenase
MATTERARTEGLFEHEHDLFRESFRSFLAKEVIPNHEQWEKDGIVPRDLYRQAGEHGFLGMAVPEQYGGAGANDFRFNAVIDEEIARAAVAGSAGGIVLQNDVCQPYFLEYCTEEQKQRWLPGIVSGDLMTAIAMTEPGAGSDLQGMQARAKRDGDDWLISGSKTFITNGIHADLVIVAAITDPDAGVHGLSLFVVERDTPGFERGRNLEKIGQHAQDTAELFFDEARVPAENLLGEEGLGFLYLVSNLAQERMSIAISAAASAEVAVEWTSEYVRERRAFGKPLGALQNTRFTLADCLTETRVTRAFVNECLGKLVDGELTAEDAAMAKMWATDMQGRVIDKCLQLFGGYGYMVEYPISRAFVDARISRIFGGANEIMKEIIGRSMNLAPR